MTCDFSPATLSKSLKTPKKFKKTKTAPDMSAVLKMFI